MAVDPTTQITQALSDPASAASDGQSVTSRSVTEQLAALAALQLMSNLAAGKLPFNSFKLQSQGAVSNNGLSVNTNGFAGLGF